MKSRKYYNSLIVFSFIIFSILSVLLIWTYNKMYFTGDAPFHFERIMELIHSNYVLPQYALNSFGSSGSVVMTMYPYILLYPIVFLFNIIGSIKYTLYIIFIIGTLITLLISYYSSLNLSKDKLLSYIFSLSYSLSYEFIAMYFTSSVIGIYFSVIFLPLVIFGFVYYLKYNKWIMLSIGMTLILCSSLITFAFLLCLLFILLIFNYKIFNYKKLVVLLKSIFLTVITTAFIWIPLLKVSLNNKLRTPTTSTIQPIWPLHVIYRAIIPSVNMPAQSLTLTALLGLIEGIILYKRLPKIIKKLYLFALFILLFFSRIFPWKIFDGNFGLFKLIRSIQTNYRLLIVPQLIFIYLLSYGITYYLRNYKNRKQFLYLVIMAIVLLQLGGQMLSLKSHGINEIIINSSLLDKNYANKDDGYHHDYYPKVLSDSDLTTLDKNNSVNHSYIHFNKFKNGKFYFNTRTRVKRLVIPFIYYNKVRYKDTLDNKSIKSYPNKKQLMTINNVKKGHHYLHIKIMTDETTICARIITLISIPLYGLLILRKFVIVKLINEG